MNGNSFQYVGYVKSINIKGIGPGSHQFLFSIVSQKGDRHWSFLLDTASEPLRYTAMANLLSIAYATDGVVRVNATPNESGPAFASEIEVAFSGK